MPPIHLLRRGPLLVAALVLVAGCGGEDPAAPPLAVPSPSTSPSQVSAPPSVSVGPAASAPPPAPNPPASRQAEAPADPLAPKPGLEVAPPATGPVCRPADLSVVDADAIVRPDAVQTVFVLRTTGPDCQLQGYPQVTLRGAGGAPLAVDVRQGGFGLKPSDGRAVALSRSTSLSFFVASGRDGSCADLSSLSVVLPGTSAPLTAPTTMQVCAGSVGITPVQRLEDDE